MSPLARLRAMPSRLACRAGGTTPLRSIRSMPRTRSARSVASSGAWKAAPRRWRNGSCGSAGRPGQAGAGAVAMRLAGATAGGANAGRPAGGVVAMGANPGRAGGFMGKAMSGVLLVVRKPPRRGLSRRRAGAGRKRMGVVAAERREPPDLSRAATGTPRSAPRAPRAGRRGGRFVVNAAIGGNGALS